MMSEDGKGFMADDDGGGLGVMVNATGALHDAMNLSESILLGDLSARVTLESVPVIFKKETILYKKRI